MLAGHALVPAILEELATVKVGLLYQPVLVIREQELATVKVELIDQPVLVMEDVLATLRIDLNKRGNCRGEICNSCNQGM